MKGPFPDRSPFGEIGVEGSPLAYLIDPGAGSGSDRVTRFWPDRATLDDIHRRDGEVTPLYDHYDIFGCAVQATLDSINAWDEPLTARDAIKMLVERLADDGLDLKVDGL